MSSTDDTEAYETVPDGGPDTEADAVINVEPAVTLPPTLVGPLFEVEPVDQTADARQDVRGIDDGAALPSPPTSTGMPLLVGSRLESAEQLANVQQWSFVKRPVEPGNRTQPDGMILHQYPDQGTSMLPGAVLAVDVVRRPTWWARFGMTVMWVLLVGALMAAAVFAFTTDVDATDNDEEVAMLEQQIAALTETLENAESVSTGLVGDLEAELNATIDDYAALVAELEEQVAGLETTIVELEADVAELTAENASLETANEELQAAYDAALEELAVARQTAADERARADGLQEEADLAAAAASPMPAFIGQQRSQVESFAGEKGLNLKVVTVADASTSPGRVVAQGPIAGTPVRRGDAIWVEVAVAP